LLILDYFKIKKYFNCIIDVYDVKKPKPNPEPVLKALKKLKVNKNQALYVGDDKVDILAGKRAGVKVVLYKQKFKNADYHINDLIKIKDIIKNLNEVRK